jgi:hypothetical protein
MCVDPPVVVVKSVLADARQAYASLPMPPDCAAAPSEAAILIKQI